MLLKIIGGVLLIWYIGNIVISVDIYRYASFGWALVTVR